MAVDWMHELLLLLTPGNCQQEKWSECKGSFKGRDGKNAKRLDGFDFELLRMSAGISESGLLTA